MTRIDKVFYKLSHLYEFYKNIKKYTIRKRSSNKPGHTTEKTGRLPA